MIFICEECGKQYEAKKHNRNMFCSSICIQRNWNKKNSAHVKEYREKTKEQRNERRRIKYMNDKKFREERLRKQVEYNAKNPITRKAGRLKKYGLSLDDFNNMLEKQNYQCAICGYSDFSDKNYFPLVDHCHRTGKVRGILCANCNHSLGKMNDDPSRLRKAAPYLEEHNE